MKNLFWKSVSLLLAFVMVFHLLPLRSMAAQTQEEDSQAIKASETVAPDTAQIVQELTNKRTAYSKEYKMDNGMHMAVVYPEPVHYEKNGQWEEIDNTLVPGLNGTYRNTAGVWDVTFPNQFQSGKQLSISKDGYTLSFGLPQKLTLEKPGVSVMSSGASETVKATNHLQTTAQVESRLDVSQMKAQAQYPETVPEKLASRLTYQGVHTGTDVIYDLSSNQVKESVVLSQYDKNLWGFQYTLQVGTMIPVLSDDGQILFYDSKQEQVILVMPAPYLVDSAEEISTDIDVTLTGSGSTYTLQYRLPGSWLKDAQRQWPVVLDPVVQPDMDVTNIRDRSVSQYRTYAYNSGTLENGYMINNGIQRSYLKYRELPELTSADMVVAATVSLYKFVTSSSTAPIEVHKVSGTWESETLTWQNKPAYDPIIEDFVICREARRYFWDVTDIVKGWYTTGNNTGMMFKASDAVENAAVENFKQFRSSDYSYYADESPWLYIWFRNSNGLESYWDYTAASAGRAGTGYVHNYTGNLVWTRPDMGFGGNRMPVSISHIYNANDASNDLFGMGGGWRTNYNQRVYRWDTNNAYYAWEDSDGTVHYFYYDSEKQTYVDEDGLELSLTDTGTGTSKYIITDKLGNTSHFDTNGRLTKLRNNQQTPSEITITYTTATGNLISTVTDGVGRKYLFHYDTSGHLDHLSYCGSGTQALFYVNYEYVGSELTKITDKDGKSCTYAYQTGNLLYKATDIDGYRIEYTYNHMPLSFAPCRVSSIRDYDGTYAGGHLTITYGHNETVFYDEVNATSLVYQFNSWGNTVSVQDMEGRTQHQRYARTEWDDSSSKGNQLQISSKLQNTVGNLYAYGNAEGQSIPDSLNNASVTHSTAKKYMGSGSICVTNPTSGTYDGIVMPGYTVERGQSLTLSCYVLPESGAVSLSYSDGYVIMYSSTVPVGNNWQRVEWTYDNTKSTPVTVYFRILTMNAGTFYVDNIQVEKSVTASRYNLVQNGDFQGTVHWTGSNLSSTDGIAAQTSSAAPTLDTGAYQITGSYTTDKKLSQTIAVSGEAKDCFVFGGWAKGQSASLANLEGETQKEFALSLTFHYTDDSSGEAVTASFNPDVNSWQYTSAVAIAEKAYSSVTVSIHYKNNANTVCFDGIQVFKEQFGSSYTYDEDGNVVSVVDLQKKNTQYEYDSNSNLTQIIQDDGVKMTYTYDEWHNVKTATTEEGQVYEFQYDAYGNNTAVSITEKTENAVKKTMSSQATYTDDHNYLSTATDALGNVTAYGYNEQTGLLDWVQYPEDTQATRTEYTYDTMYRMATVGADLYQGGTDTGKDLSASYTYTDDYLTAITTASTTYNFTYGKFGLRESVKVGTVELAGYTYDAQNRLQRLDYGNGAYVEYDYDSLGRLICQTYEDEETLAYAYDNSGNLATVTDSATGVVITYYYDLTNRQSGYREKGANLDHTVKYTYDENNNLTTITETINEVTRTYVYTYDDDNRLVSETVDGITVTYTYDGFGRLENRLVQNSTAQLSNFSPIYTAGSGNNAASTQVSSYNGYTYTYDGNGNILTVSDGTNTTSYEYDTQNQLIRENNQEQGFTHTWTYDNAGNILTRTEYDYTAGTLGTPTDTVTYTYGNSNWGDQLTGYDGNTITYDDIGNPLTDGEWTYTWQNGRQLASMSNGTTTWTFSYDANGRRTKRTNGEKTYTYVYNGDQLSQMTVDGHAHYFSYDASGRPLSITTGNCTYTYITNLQGDVVGIQTQRGTTFGTYAYDAWGNATYDAEDQLHAYNPLMYRGYVYDVETGLYYLNSRYYNPETGRFLNADNQLNEKDGMLGYNMFAYAQNNPIMYEDPTGHSVTVTCIIIGVALGAVIGGCVGAYVSQKQTGEINGWAVAAGVLGGGAFGGLIGWGVGVALTACGVTTIGGAGVTVVGTITQAEQVIHENWQSAEQGLREGIKSVSNYADRVFTTPMGDRIVDAYNKSERIIAEAKYGYQACSTFIQSEIARDAYLLQSGMVDEVQWHFYYSQVSETIGGSYNLIRSLLDAGIQVFYH